MCIRDSIHNMLQNIRLESFPVTGTADAISLKEMLIELSGTIEGIDPEGINFIVDQNTGQIQQSGIGLDPNDPFGGDPNDPFGGGFPQAQEEEDVNIALEVNITIDPPLRNITLGQLLEIIVKISNIPIKYSVEDWGIIFSHAPAEGPRLETRTYRVDPDTFIQGLQSVGVSYVSADSGAGGGGMGGMGGGGGMGLSLIHI